MPRRTAAQAAAWREAFITSTSRLALPIRELRLVETGAQVPTRTESAAMYASGQYPCARAGPLGGRRGGHARRQLRSVPAWAEGLLQCLGALSPALCGARRGLFQ